MTTTADADPQAAPTLAHLPQPRGDARWRWTTPRKAAVAGGALAALFGIGLGIGAGTAGAASTNGGSSSSGTHPSSSPGATPPGRPPGARPTVGGKITALEGDRISVQTPSGSTVTVVYGSGTTFSMVPANGGSVTSSSAAALKVGEYVGVQGTKSNGTVTAKKIVISTTAPPGPGRTRPAGAGNGSRASASPGGAPPSA